MNGGAGKASSPALPGNLPCDIWLPALRRKVKVEAGGGAPGALSMAMQRSNVQHHHHHPHHQDFTLCSGFGCAHQAAAAHPQVGGQVEALDRGPVARRSKIQKFNMSKKVFPWMKESRHNQTHGRRTSDCTVNEKCPGATPASKRTRTAYTSAQLVELEKEFHFSRYLCRPRRVEMASLLNLHERQIKIWFQNRRMKQKKDERQQGLTPTTSSSSPPSSPSAPGSPTLSSLGYVHVGGDYQAASPPLQSQSQQQQPQYPAQYSKYPALGFTHGPPFEVQYDTHGSAHTTNQSVDVTGSFFPQSCCSSQDRIMQAPKLTHL